MELYIMDKNFVRQDVVETFDSLIWTERYYGDSEVELVVPLTSNLIQKLTQKQATFLGVDKSDEPMIIETASIEEGKLKVKGISILSWLNNRFIRTSPNHRLKVWIIKNQRPGLILWTIVKNMCTSQMLTVTMGLSPAQKQELIIPNLGLENYDNTGTIIKSIKVAYGPLYDELKRIAEVYKIGMQITLDPTTRALLYRNYKGINHTSDLQGVPPLIRFSIDMDSFSDVKELRSTAGFKTVVHAFAQGLEKSTPELYPNLPGSARRSEASYTGFDLRAKMILTSEVTAEDLTGTVAQKQAEARDLLETEAEKELKKNKYIQNVEGEISPANQFKYGIDYNLGDLIEVEGPTGAIERSRVIEYIRIHDETGERAYPTVEAVEP